MQVRYAGAGLALIFALPLFAQRKEDERLANSADVLRQILSEDNGLPRSILDQAVCVLIYPSVKKVALGFGQAMVVANSCAERDQT
jgi:hypothetical protein